MHQISISGPRTEKIFGQESILSDEFGAFDEKYMIS